MPGTIATGPVHHLRLTVADVDRARAFSTEVLGFTVVLDLDPGYVLGTGIVPVDGFVPDPGAVSTPFPDHTPAPTRIASSWPTSAFAGVGSATIGRASPIVAQRVAVAARLVPVAPAR